jgi:predicted CXXCH cytochrome family protein
MKKLFLFFVAVSLTMGLYGAIAGTAHDFSVQAWNPSGEICIVCHTPHNADPYGLGLTYAPLWNHDADMTTVYTLYSSATLQATPGQPTGVSKLCLSCHDGVTAIDSFGSATGTTFLTAADSTFVDVDLSNDHPVSFTYNATTPADPEIFDPTTATTPLGGTIQDDLLDGGTTMECSSCHDVHGVTGTNYLLKIANTGSQLCLTCHDK